MKSKNGKEYEQLVELIYNKLAYNSPFTKVERNIKLPSAHGDRQIDILLTAKTMGLELRTIVECRDHKRKVDVSYIDSVSSKMRDVKAHKGVVVSRAGFTSGARSKAREMDIDLCVAQEALHEKWHIDVAIPVLVFEAIPHRIELHSDFPETIDADFAFHRDKMFVNDKDIFSIIREQWNNGKLALQSDEYSKKVLQAELPPPHFIKDRNGNKVELKTLQIRLEYEVRAYFGNLKEVENTQLLMNLSRGESTVFFETAPIKDYKKRFRAVHKNEILPFEALSLVVKTGLQIANVKGSKITLHTTDN